MPDLVLDAPTAVKNALAKLNALRPRVEELENVDANLAAAKSALKEAKDELVSVEAERDRTRTEYASARSELVTVQGGLAAGFKRLEELEQQIKRMERQV
jgi:septal ring factor EnvC (AmiA/AmiB activator)